MWELLALHPTVGSLIVKCVFLLIAELVALIIVASAAAAVVVLVFLGPYEPSLAPMECPSELVGNLVI